ncbi:MAG: glycosyltransferase family 4 protein [Bryobacteraceae bacterium]
MQAPSEIRADESVITRCTCTSALLSDARWNGPHGIGRFAREVLSRLPGHTQLENGPKVFSPADSFWLTYQIITKRPRVFFSPGFNPPLICPAPLVFTIHDLIQIQVPEVSTVDKLLYYRAVLRPAARRAYRVLTVSNFCRDEIITWCGLPPDRVVNVGNGVGPVFRPAGPKYEPGFPYMLYVGSQRAHKNLHRLVQAFRKIDFPQVCLLVTGVATPEFRRSIEEAGVTDRVRFLGCVPDDQLAATYRGAMLLVLPSVSEGFGLPPLEAMACGTPVVVSRCTAPPEVVGDAGVLVNPFDIEDLRRGLELVLGDAARRSRLSRLGIQRSKHFSWDRVAERVRAVLEDAAGRAL